MNKLVAALFSRAFDPLVTLIATLLRPSIAMMPVDFAVLSAAFGHLLTLARLDTPQYAAVGVYTATDVEDIVESMRPILAVINTEVPGLGALTELQQVRLLEAVAARLAP